MAVEFSPAAKAKFDEILTRYPIKRAAIMPTLWLAQEEFGWLSNEVLEYVAGLLELSPAFTAGVASFYTMYYKQPVGKHHVQVCTNLSCALVGAQEVVRAFESELGIQAGETTEDGQVTLRVVECLGGCGYAPVVTVDHRHRHPVEPDDVPGIVEEIRAGA